MKLRYILIICFISFLGVSFSYSQETMKYSGIEYSFNQAQDLYDKQMYGAAQKLFAGILQAETGYENSAYTDDAAFYFAMCAMHLTQRTTEHLISSFIAERPESYNNQEAIFQMANYHFGNRKYRNALQWYEKVDRPSLDKKDIPEYNFKMGFSHFARKDYDRAAKSFYEVRNADAPYGPMSLYFYSHIKYLSKQYQTALIGFTELKENPVYASIVPFYIVQIYYLQEKYDEILEYAPGLIKEVSGPQTAEISKMIGSSYFKTGEYEKAIPFLNTYQTNTKSTTDFDNYEYGFSLYMTEEYEEAAKVFSKIVSMRDTLSQNAAYHMADCYLKTGRKKDAKLAFETASRYKFNSVIREDALFNYAQLSFELDINPFNQAINALTTYIEEYPKSLRIDKAYSYLVDAFWSTKNYKDAISTIEKMKNRSPKLDEAYQRLTYYRGLEMFTNLKFDEAITYFDKSLKYGQYNATVRSLCIYWKADAFFRKGDYNKAIKLYSDFISSRGAIGTQEFDYAHYNIGYAYYDLKDYDNASTWFRKFENQARDKNTTMFNDALNRIGDTYYINRDFPPAAEYYKKSAVLDKIDTDYALYQMSLSYGGMRQSQQKVWGLSRLLREHPNSEYAGNATYEAGRTYNAELNKPDSAKYYFNILLTKYPNSSVRKYALSNMGSIFFNEKNYNKSLDYFKLVVAEFPNTPEASNAVEMIKATYIAMNQTEEYFEYASNNLDGYEVSQDEQDSISFLAAKNLYIDQNFYPALQAFTNFLNNFPNSRNAVEAHYYKAELHFHFEEKDKAMTSYMYVADAPRGIYSETSTIRAAGLLFDKEDYQTAFNYYDKLYKIAENRNNKLIAAVGRLRCAYFTEMHDEVIAAAIDVVENDRSNEEQIREAYYKMAKAHYAKEQNIRALSLFERLAVEVTSYEGAESKYRVAEINFLMNKDTIAENIVYEFAQMNSPQQFWIAKSFILLSDISLKRGDFFSAKHTLQSVLNNYSIETDGIKDLASDKLSEIIEIEQGEKATDEFLDLDLKIKDEDSE
jgi:tetratricopeptide (TPR) repeat protein